MKYELAEYHNNTPEEELLKDLRRVARKLKRKCFSIKEYAALGKYDFSTYFYRFGSWSGPMRKAGLQSYPLFRRITDELLFENIKHVWDSLGKQPTQKQMKSPLSKHVLTTYLNRFGTWRKALKAFVQYINTPRAKRKSKANAPEYVAPERIGMARRRANKKTIHARMRYLTITRDKRRCQRCGKAPTLSNRITLDVEHITPFNEGGKTVLENLRTICSACLEKKKQRQKKSKRVSARSERATRRKAA
jgi:hypothetical protein